MPVCLFIISIIFVIPAKAQEKPPKPITVTVSTAQHLSFGTFIQAGSAGTVTVTPQQLRSATGSIILPNMSSIVTPALFIVTALPGTLITIQFTPSTLHASNGGTISLVLDDSDPKSPFIVPGVNTPGGINTEVEVFVGGTLTVGPLATNPAGAYSGTFNVTFIQQ